MKNVPLISSHHNPIMNLQEGGGIARISAVFLGIAIISMSVGFGNGRLLDAILLCTSFFVTFLWRNNSLPWIFLVSVVAASPAGLGAIGVPCNLLFAVWLIVFRPRYVTELPKWIYFPIFFGIIGFACSSFNWISGDVTRSILQQTAYMFNYLMAPLVVLPIIYLRMGKSENSLAKLQGLFCLIVPSTVILLLANFLGKPIRDISSEFVGMPGFMSYQFGHIAVNLTRTIVGFLLASLVCSSMAIAVSRIKPIYRLLAAVCLVVNVLLLLITGSVGSSLACLCGMGAIFYAMFRTGKLMRWLISIMVISGLLLLAWYLSPVEVKKYVQERYQYRVSKGVDQDRFVLWARATHYLSEHPEGVGFTNRVGDKIKSNTHNDYLVFAVSYGIIGGIAYAYLIVGLLAYFLNRIKKIRGDPQATAIHLAGLGVIVVLAINSMSDHLTGNRWYFNIIWSIIWYCYFCSRSAQSEMQSGIVGLYEEKVDMAVSEWSAKATRS